MRHLSTMQPSSSHSQTSPARPTGHDKGLKNNRCLAHFTAAAAATGAAIIAAAAAAAAATLFINATAAATAAAAAAHLLVPAFIPGPRPSQLQQPQCIDHCQHAIRIANFTVVWTHTPATSCASCCCCCRGCRCRRCIPCRCRCCCCPQACRGAAPKAGDAPQTGPQGGAAQSCRASEIHSEVH